METGNEAAALRRSLAGTTPEDAATPAHPDCRMLDRGRHGGAETLVVGCAAAALPVVKRRPESPRTRGTAG
jgi:hypothetical protein